MTGSNSHDIFGNMRLAVKEKDRDVHVRVIGAHELMRASDKRQGFLANAAHW
jgi:hypothetical protein